MMSLGSRVSKSIYSLWREVFDLKAQHTFELSVMSWSGCQALIKLSGRH